MRKAVRVRVPATSANLGPGFDAFGAAVSLHLTATAHPSEPDDPRVTTAGEGADELPGDDGNLLWRAFVAFCEHLDTPPPEVRIEVGNGIPLERGLGSSSAAIVAGLGLARAVTGRSLGDRELAVLADRLEGHPDNVVPAILGGLTVTARGDDGGLVIRRVNPTPSLVPVLLVPEARQSTAAARGVLPETLPAADATAQAARAGLVIGALTGAWPPDAALSGDLLHEPPRLAVMTESGALVRSLRDAGVMAWLSGAGPAVTAAARRSQVELVEALGGEHRFAPRVLTWDLAGLVTVTK